MVQYQKHYLKAIMVIVPLNTRLEHCDQVAKYIYQEWRHISNHRSIKEVLDNHVLPMCNDNTPMFLVAVDDDNNLLGFCSIMNDFWVRFFLSDMFVLPQARNQGVATALVSRTKQYIATNFGLLVRYLYLYSDSKHEMFWQKQGFEADAITDKHSNKRMWCKIAGS